MNTFVLILAFVGGLAIIIGLVCGLVHLHELFERVETLECNDNVRREDIIDIRSQIMHLKEDR